MKRSLKFVSTGKELVHLYTDVELGKFVVHYLPNNQPGEYKMTFTDINEATKMMDEVLNKAE